MKAIILLAAPSSGEYRSIKQRNIENITDIRTEYKISDV